MSLPFISVTSGFPASRRKTDEIALRAWCLAWRTAPAASLKAGATALRTHRAGIKLTSTLFSGDNRLQHSSECGFVPGPYWVIFGPINLYGLIRTHSDHPGLRPPLLIEEGR